MNILKDWFTNSDGDAYSLTKVVGFAAGCAMIVEFVRLQSQDWSGFATGVGIIMGALAAKHWVEKK